jgi:hypothetical protein
MAGRSGPCAVDGPRVRGDDSTVDEELDPREEARVRRRDHDADAERRDLMRSGMGKVFKQILDRQAREADEEPPPRRRRTRQTP